MDPSTLMKMLGIPEESISSVLDQAGWAQDEIEKAQRRHGEEGKDGPIWNAFLRLQDRREVMQSEIVFRAHCRELIERIVSGGDLAEPTAVEMMLPLREASLRAPLTSAATGLYLRLFARALPDEAEQLFEEMGRTVKDYERIHGDRMNEAENELRKKLSSSRGGRMDDLYAPSPRWDVWATEPQDRYGLIVLVGCGRAKKDEPCMAGEMYTGSFHKLCRQAGESMKPDRLLILSAKHGLLAPEREIKPYDTRLGDIDAVTTHWVQRQAKRNGLLRPERVVVLAGRAYLELARTVWPDAESPLEGARGIGQMLGILARIRDQQTGATTT